MHLGWGQIEVPASACPRAAPRSPSATRSSCWRPTAHRCPWPGETPAIDGQARVTQLAGVELYGPQKGVRQWYEQEIAEPWGYLVRGGKEPRPEQDGVVDMSIALDAAVLAVSNILTDSNFQEQKAKQLGQGPLPTLLMIRAYGLTSRFEELVTVPTATVLAERIPNDAWACLPERCQGLLLAFLGDVVQDVVRRQSPMMFVPASGRPIEQGLWEFLTATGALTKGLLDQGIGLP